MQNQTCSWAVTPQQESSFYFLTFAGEENSFTLGDCDCASAAPTEHGQRLDAHSPHLRAPSTKQSPRASCFSGAHRLSRSRRPGQHLISRRYFHPPPPPPRWLLAYAAFNCASSNNPSDSAPSQNIDPGPNATTGYFVKFYCAYTHTLTRRWIIIEKCATVFMFW